MAMVINTNMASANAVRLLDSSSKEQATSMERLTSGLRINSSADDAAGLAIATKMTTQITGTAAAVRNANDGISMAQTIDSATEEVVSMMQRMRELGVQSMNETYSTENRTQMNGEYEQLAEEINRISDTTKFNGINLMNAAGSLNLQAGWETTANDQIAISTIDMGSDALATFVTDNITAAVPVTAGVDGVGDKIVFAIGATALGTAESITLAFGETVNGVTLGTGATATQYQEALAYKINSNSALSDAGFNASVDGTGLMTLTSDKSDVATTDYALGTGSVVSNGTVLTAAAIAPPTLVADGFSGSVATTDITTTANAKVAVDRIDTALSDLSTYRSEIGATQNRLDHTISNLSSVNENILAARSRILDADFATESANLARTQVLQQAGMSMLSQANANSQNVLALLQ